MVVLLLLGMFVARSAPHLITSLDVPRYADPRREAELSCHYARQPQDPPLHSVKWYRDMHEIFRYTPQEYETRAFNSTGVSITNSSCEHRACVITVRPESGTAKYTCEVSSEGPRFAVDRRSANMTLAVLPEYDPLITGLPTIVQAGEQAMVNCTSDYSLPAATIDWFVDSEPQEWSVIGWVTKYLYLKFRSASEGTLSRWSRLNLQLLAPANPHWARVMAQSPYSIHREGLCPSSGDINMIADDDDDDIPWKYSTLNRLILLTSRLNLIEQHCRQNNVSKYCYKM
ncbi:hypothetical protein evm_005358 [Chilo suppressalis]|nr:hypothetical protein evm_005358 [Chilo suppressalis]